MCEQLATKARAVAQGSAWDLFRTPSDEGRVPAAVKLFLEQKLRRVAEREPERYNENSPLGNAITEAVDLADNLEAWPDALSALAQTLDVSCAELLMEAAVAMPEKHKMEVTMQMVRGLSALMWSRSTLVLDLTNGELQLESALALFRAFRPAAVTSLKLSGSFITFMISGGGRDPGGVRALCSVLHDSSCALGELDLSGNYLGPDSGVMLGKAIAAARSLNSINLSDNDLVSETDVKADLVQGTSFGVGDEVTYEGREMIIASMKNSDGEIKLLDLSGVKALADGLATSNSLTSIDMSKNRYILLHPVTSQR